MSLMECIKKCGTNIRKLREKGKLPVQYTVLLGLLGPEEAFELGIFKKLLNNYANIGDAELRQNLYYFIQQATPVAQNGRCGYARSSKNFGFGRKKKDGLMQKSL